MLVFKGVSYGPIPEAPASHLAVHGVSHDVDRCPQPMLRFTAFPPGGFRGDPLESILIELIHR